MNQEIIIPSTVVIEKGEDGKYDSKHVNSHFLDKYGKKERDGFDLIFLVNET